MKNLTLITKTAFAFIFTFVLLGMQNQSFAADIELKDGTPVRLKQMQTITSADARPEQLVSFEVLEDVKIGSTTVINQGTLVLATVVVAAAALMMRRMGDRNGAVFPVAEEKTKFDVILINSSRNRISVIKVVMEITGLGLKEAKDLVESAPKPVKEGVSKDEADTIRTKLTEAGATVDVK